MAEGIIKTPLDLLNTGPKQRSYTYTVGPDTVHVRPTAMIDESGNKIVFTTSDPATNAAAVPMRLVLGGAALPVTGPLTDTQMRATPVPVSGTFFPGTQPVSGPLTDAQMRATPVPVSGTFFQATQPVSGPLTDTQLRATALPVTFSGGISLATGANVIGSISNLFALDATLTGGSQKSINRGAAKGTTTAADITSTPVDANTQAMDVSVKGSVPVTGTFWLATQPVSGTFWQATQPVSGPLTDTQLRATPVPVSGTFFQGTQPVSGPLTDTQLRASAVPVSGAFFQATQPVSGTFWQATQPVSGPLTDTQLRATPVPVSGTFFQGTQPVSGPLTDTQLRASQVPIVRSIDISRSSVAITVTNSAPAVAETLQTLVKTVAGVSATGATTIPVTAGKKLRITSIRLDVRATAATVPWAKVILRMNPSGAAIITSPLLINLTAGGNAAAIGNAASAVQDFSEGLEFSGTQQLAVTLQGNVTTNVVDITLIGYEY